MLGTKRKPIKTLLGGIHTSAASRPYAEALRRTSSAEGCGGSCAAHTVVGWEPAPGRARLTPARCVGSTVDAHQPEPRVFLGEDSSGKGIAPEYPSPQKAVRDGVRSSQLKDVMIFQSIHQPPRHRLIRSTWQRHKAPLIYYHSSDFRNSFSCYKGSLSLFLAVYPPTSKKKKKVRELSFCSALADYFSNDKGVRVARDQRGAVTEAVPSARRG